MSDCATADASCVRDRDTWSTDSPSVAIVDAIAALEGVDPETFTRTTGTVLFDHVDPDALNALVTDAGATTIAFPVGDYYVRISDTELCVCTDRISSGEPAVSCGESVVSDGEAVPSDVNSATSQ